MMRLGTLLMAGVLEDGIEDHIMKSSRQWIDKNFDGVYLADSLDAERTGNHIAGMFDPFCSRYKQLHVYLGHVWRESQLCRQR